jgi:hypothetical protein
MNERSLVSYGTWVLIVLVSWTIAWIVANAIPVFNDLLTLLAAAFGSWFSFGLEGLFWMHLNWGEVVRGREGRKVALAALNGFLIVLCCLMVSFPFLLLLYFACDGALIEGLAVWYWSLGGRPGYFP